MRGSGAPGLFVREGGQHRPPVLLLQEDYLPVMLTRRLAILKNCMLLGFCHWNSSR